ncbi:MAG: YCF48-related protein, partial [bacterium]|nr:YCF48-related protein [bacterium]
IGLSTGEIIVSRNSGSTWDLLSTISNRVLEIVPKISDSRQIFALGMDSGLHQSTDSGASWQDLTKDLRGERYQDFFTAPTSTIAYLATSKGLFRSFDEGKSWEKLQLPHNESTSVVSAAALNPKKPSEIYAVVSQTLYKSFDNGATWQVHALQNILNVRGMVIDPNQPNVIYMALGAVLK